MVNGENAAGLPKLFIVQLQKRKLVIYYTLFTIDHSQFTVTIPDIKQTGS